MGRQIRGLGRSVLILLLTGVGAGDATGQEPSRPGGGPEDVFGDSSARTLVLRALSARQAVSDGLVSYEGLVTERMRVGVAISPRILTRERTLFRRERVSRIRWDAGELSLSRTIHDHRESPTFGGLGLGEGRLGMDFDVEDELALDDLRGPSGVRPDVRPVGPLRRGLQSSPCRTVDSKPTSSLSAIPSASLCRSPPRPSPSSRSWSHHGNERGKRWRGSLWFDGASGRLVRAIYRPSGPWDHEVQQPGDLEGVPGFLLPARGRVTHIVLEYAFYEERWWLPRRLLGEGVFDWNGLVRMPLTIEWALDDVEVNQALTDRVAPGPDGAERVARMRAGGARGVTRFSASHPSDSLIPLPGPLGVAGSRNFTDEELEPVLERLDDLARLPPTQSWRPSLRSVFLGLRYNRIQGLVAWSCPGAIRAMPDGRWRHGQLWRPTTREPEVEVTVEWPGAPRTFALSGYHQVAETGDFGQALGLGNSVSGLAFGWDDGNYYRRSGAKVTTTSFDDRIRVGAFVEHHRTAPLPDWDLPHSPRGNLVALEGTFAGMRARLQTQRGDDSREGILSVRLWGEGASGPATYGRLGGELSGSRGLPGSLTGSPPDPQLVGIARHSAPTAVLHRRHPNASRLLRRYGFRDVLLGRLVQNWPTTFRGSAGPCSRMRAGRERRPGGDAAHPLSEGAWVSPSWTGSFAQTWPVASAGAIAGGYISTWTASSRRRRPRVSAEPRKPRLALAHERRFSTETTQTGSP